MTRVGLYFLATVAAFQPPLRLAAPRASSSHRRAPTPSAGFFDELKEGFDGGLTPPSSPSPSTPPSEEEKKKKKKSQNKFLAALTFLDDGDTAGASSGNAPSLFNAIKALVSPESLTVEERVAAGEGVVWSGDFSRAWRATNGFPNTELSVAEAKELLEELSLPIPPEVGGGEDA